MGIVMVRMGPETEQKLRRRASLAGETLEVYLGRLAEKAAASEPTTALDADSEQPARYVTDPKPTPAEFDRLLAELAAGPPLPVLPADFSRADIYDDHD